MAVKDGIGNELQEGDVVLIMLDKPFVIGQVVSLKEGGIDIASAKNQKSPGVIQVSCPQTIAFAPGPHTRINVMFKVSNPESQKLIEEVAARANAGVAASVATMPGPKAVADAAKPPVES